MSDGHRGGFNSAIKVARGPITFAFGYLVEGEEGSFWLHVKVPRSESKGELGVREALGLLGFKVFPDCNLLSGECCYLQLRGREPRRPLAGEQLEPTFDRMVEKLPGIINDLLSNNRSSAARSAESLGLKLAPVSQ